jgi:hypothetical protein
MNRTTAIALSVILHPIFVNMLALFVLMQLHPILAFGMGAKAKWFFLGFFFLSAAILPLLGVVILRITGGVSSIMLDQPDERRVPYIITSLLLMFTFYLFKEVGAPSIIQLFCLVCAAIVVVMLIINTYSKFSIHMASMGLLCGVVYSFSAYTDVRMLLAGAILLTGMTGTARLFADAHTFKQLLGGFIVGLLITIVLM